MKPRPISNPPNPWMSTEIDYLGEPPPGKLEVFDDHSREIIAHNDSPDVGFTFSVNPYRGCMHACAYCYARPPHEYLSFGGGTDCYQPLEASLRLTRQCLEVCAEYRNPVAIITKAPLIERDLDVLQSLARRSRVSVSVSIPFWNQEHARAIEPQVATPRRRIEVIRRLAQAGVPVGVSVAPIIPGLGDEDIGLILEAAKDAGASHAGYVLLRLPGSVKAVFSERLRLTLPERAERVLHRIRETRGGRLYDSRFGSRGRGEGLYADAIRGLFQATARRLGLLTSHQDQPTTFQRPEKANAQLQLL